MNSDTTRQQIAEVTASSTINVNNSSDVNNSTLIQNQINTKSSINPVNTYNTTIEAATPSSVSTPITTIQTPTTLNNSTPNTNTIQYNSHNTNIIPVTVVANFSQSLSNSSQVEQNLSNSKLSAAKINQFPTSANLSTPFSSNGSTVTTTATNNSNNNGITNVSIQSNQNAVQVNGFAHCVNCGDRGVKAAFYGKSKLYCSTACQNGVKKQQQQSQPSQGIKRTIEALNHSPINNNVLHSNPNNNSSNIVLIATNQSSNIATTVTPTTVTPSSLTHISNTNSISNITNSNSSNLQTISASNVLPSTTLNQSNLHQLPPISTITVLSVPPSSHQLTNNSVSGGFISNTLKTNLVNNNGQINQQNTNNLAQLITNTTTSSSSPQNIQIINGTQFTSITPLTPLNSVTTNSNTIINNISSNNGNNSSVTVDASNILNIKEISGPVLVGVSSNNNISTTNEATSKDQQISSVASQGVQSVCSAPLTSSSSSSTGVDTGIPNNDSCITQLPQAKRPRHSSVSSSVSNSGSTYSSSSKHEAKSTISAVDNNDNDTLSSSQKTGTTVTNQSFPVQETVSQSQYTAKLSPTNKFSTTLNRNGTTQGGFDWPTYLEKENATAASVQFFKHVPLRHHFENFSKKIKQLYFEVINTNPPPADVLPLDSKFANKSCYWYANIVKFAGYYAKLRFLGYEDDGSADFWVHFCDQSLHSIGYSLANGYPLIAPYPIYNKISDLSEYAQKHLLGKETLPQDYSSIINESLKSKFKKGMILELVDKKKLSSMRVSRIIDNIGGRLRMKYENSEEFDDFWCNESSELIHPVGWSMEVGHDIYATGDYKKSSLSKYKDKTYDSSKECSPDMFKKVREAALRPFRINMKLETIDPLCLSSIRVATVAKILKHGYLMIRIDGAEENDMFCYHRSSPSIFPAGFCQKNNLKLHPPYGYKGEFTWEKYLKETNSEFAPIDSFYTSTSKKNPFEKGMKLESVDLMEPKMICVATVTAVVDRLILLSFDGWDNAFDQWVDWESCDIYPMGWSKFVGYPLEEIRKVEPEISTINKSKRARKATTNQKKK